jgi:hypothetical protein
MDITMLKTVGTTKGRQHMWRLKAGRQLTRRGGYGVLRQLQTMRSDAAVYWGERSNSYVAVQNDAGSYAVYSINGIGEIRWKVEPWNRDAESLAAIDYFFDVE